MCYSSSPPSTSQPFRNGASIRGAHCRLRSGVRCIPNLGNRHLELRRVLLSNSGCTSFQKDRTAEFWISPWKQRAHWEVRQPRLWGKSSNVTVRSLLSGAPRPQACLEWSEATAPALVARKEHPILASYWKPDKTWCHFLSSFWTL